MKAKKYPGSWLYKQSVIQWVFDSSLRKQFPFLYRLFCCYCVWYLKIFRSDYVYGGRNIFLLVVWISRKLMKKSYHTLYLPKFAICLYLHDPRILKVVNEFQNENPDIGVLHKILSAGDTFVDIGANHGSFSIVASKLVGENGLIIAVEAQPRLTYAIEESLRLNACSPYKIFQTAVGEQDGEIEFLIPTDTSGSAGIFPKHSARYHHRQIKVPLRKFDNLIDWRTFPGKVVIKVDIEGSEYAFLQGAKEMISKLQPILLLEINPNTISASGTKGDELICLLKEYGYQWYTEIKNPAKKIELTALCLEVFRNVILYMN